MKRFKSRPRDFTWDELVRLMRYLGYKAINPGKTGGSRRKFINREKHIIIIHEPHPGKIIKQYIVNYIIETLGDKIK